MDDKWRALKCRDCGGHGVVSDIAEDGDFIGPKDCPTCDGHGRFYIRPSGQLFKYPGGPVASCGYQGTYEEATPVVA